MNNSKLKSLLLYDGLENEAEYNSVVGDIKEQNRKNLFAYNIVLTFLFTVLFILSLLVDVFKVNRAVYCGCIFPFAILTVVLALIKNKLLANTIVTYVFLTIISVFMIQIGVFSNPSGSAVGFNVFLVLAPLVTYDRAHRSLIYRIIVTIIFIVLLFQVKESSIALTDTINAVCYGSAGAMIGLVY